MMVEKVCPSVLAVAGMDSMRGEGVKRYIKATALDSPGPRRQQRLKVTRDKLRNDYSLLASVA